MIMDFRGNVLTEDIIMKSSAYGSPIDKKYLEMNTEHFHI